LWSGLLVVLAFFCSRSSSCGLSTHVEIGKYWNLVVLLKGPEICQETEGRN
jgi:hypothetical protein